MSDQLPRLYASWIDQPGFCPWTVDVMGVQLPVQALLDLAYLAHDPVPADWSGFLEAAGAVQRCLEVKEWSRLPLTIGTLTSELHIQLVMSELLAVIKDATTTTTTNGPQAGFTAVAHRLRVLIESGLQRL